ncbi:dual specificity protein phosphatase 3-like [Thrips palmi]|uniref:protein-serine/threonine phosphatase n=1 Tax=Thrips palmi TaxID=161013 RepID=A0A6P8ZVR4_THRPL|nr:dual specificity protein phosphatase 3-like [Thrips palmi]
MAVQENEVYYSVIDLRVRLRFVTGVSNPLSFHHQVSKEQLKRIIRASKPHFKALPTYEGTSLGLFGRVALGLDCDEMYPNLFVGDMSTALCKPYLRKLGITHVFNAAEGNFEGMVNSNGAYYNDIGVQYMGIPLVDHSSSSLCQYFLTSAQFIDDAIRGAGKEMHLLFTAFIYTGKVLVHCVNGYSRSPAITVAYLAIKVNMPVPMALKLCCAARKICPNDGFLNQLAILGNTLSNC